MPLPWLVGPLSPPFASVALPHRDIRAREIRTLNWCNSLSLSYKSSPLGHSRMLQMGRQTVTRRIRLEGVDRPLIFTIHKLLPSSADFTFRSLAIDGQEYSLCCRASTPHFDQWVYLLSQHAFRTATVELEARPYVLQSHAAFTPGPVDSTLVWNLTVNYVMAACSGVGVAMDPRKFTLVFHRKGCVGGDLGLSCI
jgi:hypothetical protein